MVAMRFVSGSVAARVGELMAAFLLLLPLRPLTTSSLAMSPSQLRVSNGTNPSEIGFEFDDENGGHFQDLQAPYDDHFCVAGGDTFTHPTALPTVSAVPTSFPTPAPSTLPTSSPTSSPTVMPSTLPTPAPTARPTVSPTSPPTVLPSALPTAAPTAQPTSLPTSLPTAPPTPLPSALPSPMPTALPTSPPTASPTAVPSSAPTQIPTGLPTPLPTASPTPYPSIILIPPDVLKIATTKPYSGSTSLYLVNLESEVDQTWNIRVANGTASDNLTCVIEPSDGKVLRSSSQTIAISIESMGAVAGGGACVSEYCSDGDFLLWLEITSVVENNQTSNQKSNTNLVPLVVSIDAYADPHFCEYSLIETDTTPQLGSNWPDAMVIVPRDVDGFRITKDTGEIFSVSLSIPKSSSVAETCATFDVNGSTATHLDDVAVCSTSWRMIAPSVRNSTKTMDGGVYIVDCDVYIADYLAGEWELTVQHSSASFEVQTVFEQTFVPKCPSYYFMRDSHGCNQCAACVEGSMCATTPELVGQSLSSLALEVGHWRSSNSSVNVYMCAYHEACITNTNTSAMFGDQLCAHGYTGPLCGTCVRGFFFSWTTQRCTACAAPSAHADTLKLWLVLFCIAAVVCAGLASLYAYAYYRGGPVLQNWLERATIAMHSEKLTISIPTKGYIILITCQTIFQFNDITTAVDRELARIRRGLGRFPLAIRYDADQVRRGADFERLPRRATRLCRLVGDRRRRSASSP